jgi:hypothetical protein
MYHRTPQAKLTYIHQLARETDTTLPPAFEYQSLDNANALIRKLRRIQANNVEAQAEVEQASLF